MIEVLCDVTNYSAGFAQTASAWRASMGSGMIGSPQFGNNSRIYGIYGIPGLSGSFPENLICFNLFGVPEVRGGLEGFLEVVRFILTEYGPVRSDMDPNRPDSYDS